jgi:hypothetical protein
MFKSEQDSKREVDINPLPKKKQEATYVSMTRSDKYMGLSEGQQARACVAPATQAMTPNAPES